MHYLVAKWNGQKWEVVFYAHNLKSFDIPLHLHPPSETCKHMVDINWYGVYEEERKVWEARKKARELLEQKKQGS